MKFKSYELRQIPHHWLILKIESDEWINRRGEQVMEMKEVHVRTMAEAGLNWENPVWRHQGSSIA